MATVIRQVDDATVDMATAINDLKATMMAQLRLAHSDVAALNTHDSLSGVFADLGFHNDVSEVTVTAANATDLGTSLTLCNQLTGVYKFHMADKLAHKVVGVDLTSYAPVTTLAAAETQANDIKAKYNVHRASTTFHYTADSTNASAASNASDQGTLNTLLNDLKTQMLAHMASGPACKSLRIVPA